MIFRLFFVMILFTGCADDPSDIRKINRETIFHANSSKIWVIHKVLKKGVNHTSAKLMDKDVVIFYESGKILIQPLKTLGTFPTKTGNLELSDDNQSCTFSFPTEKWTFRPKEISAKIIKLTRTSESDFSYDLELISYPESENLKLN